MKKLDWFAGDLPTINLGGERKVKTSFGGLVTVIIGVILVAYAAVKVVKLVEGEKVEESRATAVLSFRQMEVGKVVHAVLLKQFHRVVPKPCVQLGQFARIGGVVAHLVEA